VCVCVCVCVICLFWSEVLKFRGGFKCYPCHKKDWEGDSNGDGDFFEGLHVFGLRGVMSAYFLATGLLNQKLAVPSIFCFKN